MHLTLHVNISCFVNRTAVMLDQQMTFLQLCVNKRNANTRINS